MNIQPTFAATKPSHRIYVVTGKGTNTSWKEIGAAWPNRDAQGFSIACDALPLTGRIVMRVTKERRPAADA